MASTTEKLVDDLLELVGPLEGEALETVVSLVRGVVTHSDGVALAARRAAEALAAEAAIRS
jgi:hypothetical protein